MDIAQLLLLRLLVTGHPHCLREDLLPSEGVVPLALPCLGEVGGDEAWLRQPCRCRLTVTVTVQGSIGVLLDPAKLLPAQLSSEEVPLLAQGDGDAPGQHCHPCC